MDKPVSHQRFFAWLIGLTVFVNVTLLAHVSMAQDTKTQTESPSAIEGEEKEGEEKKKPVISKEMEAITVTEEPYIPEGERLRNPVPTTGVDRPLIEQRVNRRAADAIKRLPGVVLEGPPGEPRDLRLQGLDKGFSRTTIDGIQLPDEGEKREFHLDRIPSFAIERIEILRNPTAEYESDGLAGRANIITRPISPGLRIQGIGGLGGLDSLDSSLNQQSLSFGKRMNEWFGFQLAFSRLDQERRRDNQKLFSTRKMELEDEEVPRISHDVSLDLGFFIGKNSELHLKPLFLHATEDKDKIKDTSGTVRSLRPGMGFPGPRPSSKPIHPSICSIIPSTP